MSKLIYISEESGNSAERGGTSAQQSLQMHSLPGLFLLCSIWLSHTLWSDPILELSLLLKI